MVIDDIKDFENEHGTTISRFTDRNRDYCGLILKNKNTSELVYINNIELNTQQIISHSSVLHYFFGDEEVKAELEKLNQLDWFEDDKNYNRFSHHKLRLSIKDNLGNNGYNTFCRVTDLSADDLRLDNSIDDLFEDYMGFLNYKIVNDTVIINLSFETKHCEILFFNEDKENFFDILEKEFTGYDVLISMSCNNRINVFCNKKLLYAIPYNSTNKAIDIAREEVGKLFENNINYSINNFYKIYSNKVIKYFKENHENWSFDNIYNIYFKDLKLPKRKLKKVYENA